MWHACRRLPTLALAKQQIFLWHVNYEWTTEVDRKSCLLNQRMLTQRFSSRDPIMKLALASKCQINLFLQNWHWTPCAELLLPHISYVLQFWQQSPLQEKYRICAEFNIVAATMLRPPEPPKARAKPTIPPNRVFSVRPGSLHCCFNVLCGAITPPQHDNSTECVCWKKLDVWSSFLTCLHLMVDLTIEQAFAFPHFPTISANKRWEDCHILQSMSSPEFFKHGPNPNMQS